MKKEQYLFSWDDFPGNSWNLFVYLRKMFGINRNYRDKAGIQRIVDDGKAIIIISGERHTYDGLSCQIVALKLNDEKTKVSLRIDDGTTDEFNAKTENGKLNIYKEQIINYPSKANNLHNSIGMEFALIPAGEFMMGSNEAWYPSADEQPVHKVKISSPFYLGIYPVTQREWEQVMGNNPSRFKGDNLPVESVWSDVQEFIKKLNEKEGTNKYRLPSEAEWEYAARAGTTTNYFFDDYYSLELDDYAWYAKNSGNKMHPVGQKMPNPWGLYDMFGNVCEWVQDVYHHSYNGAPTDGSAWEADVVTQKERRVTRGGGWGNPATALRSASRSYDGPGHFFPYEYPNKNGFRLVREV